MGKGYKVLLVDDERLILVMQKAALEEQGFEVHLAESARGALEIFKEVRFDLVITDILMPEMNGIELIRSIREIEPRQKIIAATSLCESDFREFTVKIEGIQYLGKPFPCSRLVELVKAAVT